ncbi:MAG: XTP/dITP diphosphatase [Candidatus Hydrothermarchaeaceae archaeon]
MKSSGEEGTLKKGKVYFLTSNKHKFAEVQEIFYSYGIDVVWKKGGYTEIQADRLEKVVKKALEDMQGCVIIEDAGLFIRALNGFPGVYSSYTLETLGNGGILKLMDGIKDRRAEFVSIAGFKDRKVKLFKGIVKGNISHNARGRSGFGYDPIFIPAGYKDTFAENFELKKKISHRKKSMEKLIYYLKNKR